MNHYPLQQYHKFTFLRIYKLLLRNIWIILPCVILALGIAFIYNRYKVPTYWVSSTILLKEDAEDRSYGAKFINSELLASKQNLQNELEIIESYPVSGQYDVPHMVSWADTERDLSAWLGNAMQSNALHELYRLESDIRAAEDADVLRDWRLLQTSDHFYYMCTKYFADGDVHKYFNPYESPYDSYINFMNVLDNIRSRLQLKRGLRLQKSMV